MKITISFSILILGVFSCANIKSVSEISVNIKGTTTVIGESKIPEKSVDDYKKAVESVVKAVYSKAFEDSLGKFIVSIEHDSGIYVKAWDGCTALGIIADMKTKLNGLSVDTYKGIGAYWYAYVHKSIASEGELSAPNSPIELNIVALRSKNWEFDDISTSISHEIAHKIGLQHPNLHPTEPPYYIGELIRWIVLHENYE